MLTEISIILILVFINGLFSMSEIAIVSARKSKLENETKKGGRRARAALKIASAPSRFLSTVQIGTTAVCIIIGLVTSKIIHERTGHTLQELGISNLYMARLVSIALLVFGITFLALTFGALLPRQVGLNFPEAIAKATALPMLLISKIATPAVWLFSKSADTFIRIFNLKPSDTRITEEEIKAMVEEGATTGAIEEIEHNLVDRVFHLGDRKLSSLMTYRREIVWLDINDPLEVNKEKIKSAMYSVYPVCDDQLDKVLGMVYTKDIFISQLNGEPVDLQKLMRPARFFPENMAAYAFLEELKGSHQHNGLVLDEYGSVCGIVTVNDLLQTLVGDVLEDAANEGEIVQREDGSYLIDAQLSFTDFLKFLELEDEVDLSQVEFHTVGGFVLDEVKDIPQTGQKFTWRDYSVEIVDMDGNRVDKILLYDGATSDSGAGMQPT